MSKEKSDFMDLFKDGAISNILASVGKVASLFNPAIGAGLMLASNITDNMADIDDKVLEDDIIGLNGSALRLDNMINKKIVDFEMLEMISHNLKSISKFSQKTAKLIK